MPVVLANAGPLIALGKLNRLELLADLYHGIQITRVVYDEVITRGLARGASDALTVRLFWQRYGWPVVEVSSAVLDWTPIRRLSCLIQVNTNSWLWLKP